MTTPTQTLANSPTREMPKYRSHKVVGALQIESIGPAVRGRCTLFPVDKSFDPFEVDVIYVKKNTPKPGWYFVEYESGHYSFSPPEAFEGGYSPI